MSGATTAVVAGTTPYPWPWDGGLRPERLALLVVSCPRPGGAATAGEAGAQVAFLAEAVRRVGGLVLAVRVRAPLGGSPRAFGAEDASGPGGAGFPQVMPGSGGEARDAAAGAGEARGGPAGRLAAGHGGGHGGGVTGLAEAVAPDRVIRAAGWSGFHGSELDAVLREARRDLLLLAGCCLELGVHSTMRAANDRGYECLLVADACASADPALTANALSTIEMSGGIFGAVGDAAAVAAALLPRPPKGKCHDISGS